MEHEQCLFSTEQLEATWILGSGAVGLDPKQRMVRLHDGQELPYDGLVITTGRRAKYWRGLAQLDGLHTLRTLDDCLALRAAAGPSTRVAIGHTRTTIGALTQAHLVSATLHEVAVIIDAADHLKTTVERALSGLHQRHAAVEEAVNATPRPAATRFYRHAQ